MPLHQPKWLPQPPTTTPSTTLLALSIFAATYTFLVVCASQTAWRDPTSIFFRADEAYEPQYSTTRLQQSENFLSNISGNLPAFNHLANEDLLNPPEICIGIPTVARKGARYLRSTLASLLEGLADEERSRIYLIVFIAEIEASQHPIFQEPWTLGLADRVLLYHDLEEGEFQDLERMDDQHKGAFDYRYLMSACIETGAEYVALIEDDVLAAEGWFGRTMDGLGQVEKNADQDWLYLRLFYTEQFLGWNSEDALPHTLWSISIIVLIATILLGIRHFRPHSKARLPNSLILSISCICLPLLIILFFKAGRITMFPPIPGVSKMNKYGCCSQGLVFPRDHASDLVTWLRETESGLFFDMRVEEFADGEGLDRWAVHPPVLQHVGMKSSSEGELKKAVAKKVWSFAFEVQGGDRGMEAGSGGDLRH